MTKRKNKSNGPPPVCKHCEQTGALAPLFVFRPGDGLEHRECHERVTARLPRAIERVAPEVERDEEGQPIRLWVR